MKDVFVVVQFYPWFESYFLLFQSHNHTIPYPKKRNMRFKPKIKFNQNIYTVIIGNPN